MSEINMAKYGSTVLSLDILEDQFSLDNAAPRFKLLADVFSAQLRISFQSWITNITSNR